MKHILLFSFSILLLANVQAQNAWFSDILQNESASYPLLSVSEDTTQQSYHILTFHEKNDSYTIHNSVYDSLMQKSSEQKHTWKKAANDKITFLGSAIMQKNSYSFFSIITASTLINELVIVEFIGNTTKIKTLDSYEIKSITNTGSYKLSISKSSKHILVMKESMLEKGKNESAQFLVFDDVFNKKSELSLSFSAISKPDPANKCYVTDKGDVFVIKKDREKTEYKFYLYAYSADMKMWNQKLFSIPGKLISDIDACLNSSDEFVVAGFYNTANLTDYEGYFYFRYDNMLKPNAKVYKRFTPEFMSDFIGKKAASKDDAVVTDYIFENLIHGQNGQTYLIAEKESYVKEESGEKFTYGDILYMGMNQDGLIITSGLLKNKQESRNDDGEWSSFNFAAVNDTLHLFHNELSASENKTKFSDASFAGTYHSRIFNKNITDTRPAKEMLYEKGDKLAFHPQYVYHTSNNQMIFILLSQDKLKYVVGKMELK